MKPPFTLNTLPGRVLILGLLLVVGTWVIYWSATSFEFVSYDDPVYVPENAIVRQGLTWAGVKWAFTNIYSGHWHPLTWLSHMAICHVFGDHPGAHHGVNILLHSVNALLFFLVLRRMTGSTIRSAVAAALFAWHPLRVESVAWVAEHKDLLAGAFWLLTIWAYLRYVERPGTGRHIMVILLFAAGLMCKAILITLPMVLLLLDLWPLRRLRWIGTSRTGPEDPSAHTTAPVATTVSWRKALTEKLPLFALVLVSVVTTFLAGRGAGAMIELPFTARVGNAFVAYARYLGKSFWPADLAVLYPHPGFWPLWQVLGSAALLAVVSFVALRSLGSRPYLAVGWFWFVGVLVPVIGLVQVGLQSMADRYSYVPMFGLVILVTWAAGGMVRHFPFGRHGALLAAAAVVLALAVVTRVQLEHWRDTVTLFSHAISVTRNNATAEYNLAQALSVRGQITEAIPHYEACLRIDPKYDSAHNNLGLVRFVQGDLTSATNHYHAALALNPNNPDAHFNLARALAVMGDVTNAIPHFETALRLAPRHPWAHYWLAQAQATQGGWDAAVHHYRAMLEIAPDNVESLFELGAILLQQGHPDKALPFLEQALHLKPERAASRVQLGLALVRLGRPEQGVAELRQSLLLDPDAVDALNNLAWILATHPRATIRNGTEAVRLAERACQLTSFQVSIIVGTLAAACAEAGRFDEAVQHAQTAQKLATAQGQTAVATRNEELLRLYRAGQPFHETSR